MQGCKCFVCFQSSKTKVRYYYCRCSNHLTLAYLRLLRLSAAAMGGRGGGRGGSRGGGGGGGASQTHYQLDGALGPRVEDYARTHDVTDLDAVVEWLRCAPPLVCSTPFAFGKPLLLSSPHACLAAPRSNTFREYQRKQVLALRKVRGRSAQATRQPPPWSLSRCVRSPLLSPAVSGAHCCRAAAPRRRGTRRR